MLKVPFATILRAPANVRFGFEIGHPKETFQHNNDELHRS